MVPQNITTAQLTGILMGIKGHKFLTITTLTEPKMRKTNNPFFGYILKRTTANVSINFKYENVVNNRLEKEGKQADFIAQPRKWGERINGTCFVMHNNAMYAELHYKSEPSVVEYIDTRTNATISKSEFESYLQEKAPSTTQGLDNEVILRDVKVSNIKELKYNGQHYVVA